MEIGTDKALRALREGRVDAMFYVAGQPVRLFAEEVTAGDDLHLVPITEPDVLGLYPAATIRAGAYPWLEEGVPTVAVRAMLMTYDYSEATPYMREAYQAVAKVARIVRDNVDWLRRSGRSHPKWRAVDLDAELVNWERSRCAEAGLTGDESYALVPGPEEVDCEAESNARRRMLCRVKQQMALQRQVARTRPESETGAAGATAEGPRYVAMDPVNLRAAPRDASDVLTVVEAGDVVRLIGRRGGWARVEYTDRLGADYTGWVHSRYLGRVNVPPEEGHKEEGGEPAARDGG